MKIQQLMESHFRSVQEYFEHLQNAWSYGDDVFLDGVTIIINAKSILGKSVRVPHAKVAVDVGAKFKIINNMSSRIIFNGLKDLTAISADGGGAFCGIAIDSENEVLSTAGLDAMGAHGIEMYGRTFTLNAADFNDYNARGFIVLSTFEPFSLISMYDIDRHDIERLAHNIEIRQHGRVVMNKHEKRLDVIIIGAVLESGDVLEFQEKMVEAGFEDWV